jgi:hypothetical protein
MKVILEDGERAGQLSDRPVRVVAGAASSHHVDPALDVSEIARCGL